MKKLIKAVLKLGGFLSLLAGAAGLILEQNLIDGFAEWFISFGYQYLGDYVTDEIMEWLSAAPHYIPLLAAGLALLLIGRRAKKKAKKSKKSNPMLLYGSRDGYVIMPSYADELGTAFRDCRELTGITISEAVKEIEPNALSGCTSLQRVHISGENLRRIGFNAFSGCSNLVEVHIPKSVKEIGIMAFSSCVRLSRVELPEGLKTIQTGTFAGCSGLHDVTIPEGIERIERNAFNGCTALERLIIPASVKNIGAGAFAGCVNLHSVKIMGADRYAFLDANAFSGCPCTVELCAKSEERV